LSISGQGNSVFGFVLKGRGFSRAATAANQWRLYSLMKNLMLSLILGGAAVYRCDEAPVFSAGFSR
jgi:hypothetical protein